MNGLHGIIFSYEQEPGLRELAERRMPASIPFGGRYRVVDFMLSNLHAAGITDVGVVLHGNYQSLLDHIGNGKTWDMARKYGGLRILPPFADTRAYRSGEFRGKMEALAGVRLGDQAHRIFVDLAGEHRPGGVAPGDGAETAVIFLHRGGIVAPA